MWGVLPPTQCSGAPFLPGHRDWGGHSATGTQGPSVIRGIGWGHERWLPGVSFLPRPSGSCCLTYIHGDILSGQGWDQRLAGPPTWCLPAQCDLSRQRAWCVQPPALWGQQLQSGGMPEVAVCTRVCREKAESQHGLHISICTTPTLAPAGQLTFLEGTDASPDSVGLQRPHLEGKWIHRLLQPSQPSRSTCQAFC